MRSVGTSPDHGAPHPTGWFSAIVIRPQAGPLERLRLVGIRTGRSRSAIEFCQRGSQRRGNGFQDRFGNPEVGIGLQWVVGRTEPLRGCTDLMKAVGVARLRCCNHGQSDEDRVSPRILAELMTR